ncbi:MAG: hypothetical protein H7Y62_13060 [Hyphomicrobium sp.]|nr:hypothetical protein [Hyphomicrobium sp.]
MLTLLGVVVALTRAPQPAPLIPRPLAVASPDVAAPSGPPSAAPQSAPAPTGRVTVTANRIKIAIHGMPLAEAVSQLAAVTHTNLDGVAVLRLAPKSVTLQWQGTSVAAAWQQLLAGDINYAAVCRERACTVHLLGLLASPQGAASAPALATSIATPQPDPPGLFPSDG